MAEDNGGARPLIKHRIVVRFSDCDPLGHVNNATYSTYLEQARIVLWRTQGGFELRSAAQAAGSRREGFILARTEINFRSQAHDGDELEVRLSLEGFGRTSATYSYQIIHVATGRLVVDAKTIQVWYDYDAERPKELSVDLRKILSTPIDVAGGL